MGVSVRIGRDHYRVEGVPSETGQATRYREVLVTGREPPMRPDPTRPSRVAMVHDHPSVMERAAERLVQSFHIEETVVARHVGQILEDPGCFDVVVLDLRLEDGTDAPANVESLQSRGWPVLLFTQAGVEEIAPAVAVGVCGIIGKGESEGALSAGVRSVLAGEPFLNDRWAQAALALVPTVPLTAEENGVLRLFSAGLSQGDTGAMLDMTEAAVAAALVSVRRGFPYWNMREWACRAPKGRASAESMDA